MVNISKRIRLGDIQSVGKSTGEKAGQCEFKGFEDALQNLCCEEAKGVTIGTRNVKDYNKSNLTIPTTSELLAGGA